MTTKVANYGSEFTVSEKLIKEVLKSNVVDRIVNMVRAREHQKLSKQLKKKKGNKLSKRSNIYEVAVWHVPVSSSPPYQCQCTLSEM